MEIFLTRFIINNMIEDTGDDIIHLKIYFKTSIREEITFPYLLPYDYLLKFLCNANVEIYNYLNKIRSNIEGYGPKHSKIFEILESENFDLSQVIQ